jgi:hypothetical protein
MMFGIKETKSNGVESLLRDVRESLMCTTLSFPDRSTLLALLGAAISIAVDGTPTKLRSEFVLHLQDALKPLGLKVDRIKV